MAAENPQFEAFIKQFTEQFYGQLLKNPGQLALMYHDQSQFSMEGGKTFGKESILAKHEKLATTDFVITTTDGHLVTENEISILVMGQLKDATEDKPLGFTHCFVLHKIGENWAISSEIFRLVLHNF